MYYKVLPEITEKQYKIMDMIWQFRFMNRHQIQKMFGYKSPRRLNDWLRDLVEKAYLGRIYSHKLLENTKPSIYYLMNNGIILHRYRQFDYDEAEAKDMKKFYEDKKASQTFINHCVNVCTLYQQFMDLDGGDWKYEVWAKNELWASDLSSRGTVDENRERDYIPDLQVQKHKEKDNGDYLFHTYNVELFDYYIPKYALEGKVRKYIQLITSEDNGHFHHADFDHLTVLLILPTQRKATRLKNYIEDQLIYEHNLKYVIFKLTTFEKVMEKGIGAEDIWKTVNDDDEEEEYENNEN